MSAEKWKEYRLEEIAITDRGLIDGPFGSNLPASEYTQTGVPIIRGSNLSLGGMRFYDDGFVFVSEATSKKLERSLCFPGDIIFTKKGTLGQIGIIPKHARYSKYLLSSNQMKLTVNENIANKDFVYLFLSAKDQIEKIQRESEYTGVPKINLAYLKNFSILLPSLSDQHRIATIITALDDKIELNRRMNETLEAMAQAVWEEWFGRYAEGEALVLLDDLVEFNPKIQISAGAEVTYVEMRDLPENGMNVGGFIKRNFSAGSKFQLYDTLLARITPCLENGKTAFVNFLEKEEKAFGSTEFIVMRAKERISPYFVYFIAREERFRQFAISSMVGSSGRQRVQAEILPSFEMIKPDDERMMDFHALAKPVFDKIYLNARESKDLTALRDILLPRLMRGEINV